MRTKHKRFYTNKHIFFWLYNGRREFAHPLSGLHLTVICDAATFRLKKKPAEINFLANHTQFRLFLYYYLFL